MTEVSTMEAGRELDAMIIGRVMEWRTYGYEDTRGRPKYIVFPHVTPVMNPETNQVEPLLWRTDDVDGEWWKPSTQIAAAMEVWEKISMGKICASKITSLEVIAPGWPGQNWVCSGHLGDGKGVMASPQTLIPFRVYAATAPLAICRAALKAVKA